MADKPFSEMTIEELKEEHAKWDKFIAAATYWGASVSAADGFRRSCAQWIKLRAASAEGERDER